MAVADGHGALRERDLSGTALSYGVDAISIPSSISTGAEYLGLRSGYEDFAGNFRGLRGKPGLAKSDCLQALGQFRNPGEQQPLHPVASRP
ncbi:MAG: hypothetical protein GX899_05780, partial [Rikenellaceae bacterium]|nr:hypothetical protein [Rikenellaceae bacterium]